MNDRYRTTQACPSVNLHLSDLEDGPAESARMTWFSGAGERVARLSAIGLPVIYRVAGRVCAAQFQAFCVGDTRRSEPGDAVYTVLLVL